LASEDALANKELIFKLVRDLGSTNRKQVGGNFLWRDVDGAHIKTFLNNFRTYTADTYGFSDRMPLPFIKKYAEQWAERWDVALYSGQGEKKEEVADGVKIGRSKRKVNVKDGYFEIAHRQVSTGTAESIVFGNDKKYGSDRQKVRIDMIKPLLMLHLIESDQGEFAAFGISFPGDATTKRNVVRIKINTVYYQSLDVEDLDKGEDDE
jgi:hypothetical protein